ncbi:axin isoform X4 [Halyomorpha halys]|uniref:axin isoform X4 n=1 Tax=Halyomorpha halys TaxID=286706 RepID=UPI0006D5123C|nr:axin isoform X4 [Halyomorpha halys]
MSSTKMPPAHQSYQAIPGEETEGVAKESSVPAKIVPNSAALTPRTSSLYQHSIPDGCAPLGFEPEGQSGSPKGETASPPGCLTWARNLHSLLSDPEGVKLFRKYLEEEGASDTLDFWFACAGLRKQAPSPPDKVAQIVRVIYRRFFLKTQLEIDESLRKQVHSRLKDSTTPLDIHVFDEACESVEKLITDTTYPNFLRSDVYLSHVRAIQTGPVSDLSSSGGESGEVSADGGQSSGGLATLHEDKELETTSSFPPLTKDMLYITQQRRVAGLRPRTETYAGSVACSLYLNGGPKGGARAYASYNPVSRQDSELQSLSSDARTESDNMSLTDSSLDSMSLSHHKMSRKQYQRHCQRVKESATLNRDPYMHQTLIPRTQRIQTDKVHPMKPEQFAAILIKKLESVKRSQEIQEKLAHKLFESEIGEGGGPSARSLADAIRERFQIDDDNDQDILDQHVSRVWSDLTPARTPGVASPRPKSPDFRRTRPNQPMNKVCVSGGGPTNAPYVGHHPLPVPHPYQTRPYTTRHVRSKDRDVFSTFSSDSGNVHDYPESLDHRGHLPKSKSMPDYADSTDTYASLQSHDGRFRGSREWVNSGGNRRYSKKPELTDSGVSVVSESVSNHGSLPNKDSRVLTWLIDSDRTGGCNMSERDSASSCSGGSRFDGKHHARGRRTPPPPGSNYMGDPSLVPSMIQAEEVRRRLEDPLRTKQVRPRCSSGGQPKVDPVSCGSTLKKGKSSSSEGFTTVVFSFCDEQFPYRSKIPGHSITLKQFKEFLPKKGNYRYFFKTECEELDMQVIQEEITDDNDVLPLWEGKVMAQVKPID